MLNLAFNSLHVLDILQLISYSKDLRISHVAFSKFHILYILPLLSYAEELAMSNLPFNTNEPA